MKETPINDFMTRNGKIREDGRVIRDMYLLGTKTKEESEGEWDLMKIVADDPGRGRVSASVRKRMPAGEAAIGCFAAWDYGSAP